MPRPALVATLLAVALCGCEASNERSVDVDPAATAPAAPPAAPATTTVDLVGQLRRAGFTLVQATRLADDAEFALALRTSPKPTGGRSVLGGRGLLPAGEPWPFHRPGRPMSFLAAIDLSEVRAAGGDRRLPDRGTLLFFADLENSEALGMVDRSGNAVGDPARVLFVPAGTRLRETIGPAALAASEEGLVLRRRWVRFERRPTLSDAFAESVPGVPSKLTDAFYDVASRTTQASSFWVGGLATGAQGYPQPTRTLKLLHLADDEDLGFFFQDAGVLQFQIPDRALRRRDWTKVYAEADSS